MNCYHCREPLTKENGSYEHIINSTIGGQTGSYNLLCEECNNEFGRTIDTELSAQLSELAILLNIKTDRPPEDPKIIMKTIAGGVKQVGAGMIPHAKLSFLAGGNQVTLFASEKKYAKLVRQKQAELSKKEPHIFAESTELPDKQLYYIQHKRADDQGNRLFGGREFFRSVTKICLNYYLSSGYDPKYAGRIIDFVNGKTEEIPHFYFFPAAYSVHDLGKNEVSHIIHLRGDFRSKVLYAYIELFNFENALVIFDMEYQGEEFQQTYCQELLEEQELKKTITIKLGRAHFENINIISSEFYKPYAARYNRILQIIESLQLPSK